MYVVGLLSLSTSPDAESSALAADLNVTLYEAGQLVRGALPSILLRTPDGARAEALAIPDAGQPVRGSRMCPSLRPLYSRC